MKSSPPSWPTCAVEGRAPSGHTRSDSTGGRPDSFLVGGDALERARTAIDDELAEHIRFAHARVTAFAQLQRDCIRPLEYEVLPGVTLGHRVVPVDSVACYVPGGHYPLIASALMSVATAKVAGDLEPYGGQVIGYCAESHCVFQASLRFPDEIQAGLCVAHLGRTSVGYEIGLFREGLRVANGWFVHVFVDRTTERPAEMPPRLRASLEALIPSGAPQR